MTVTVYRSTDASAPSLNGTVGSLISVLDACLVNGYGAKAAAGWAKAFTGTNLAAYRPALGNRFYLGVDDTVAQNARVRGFETMTAAGVAVASGTGPFPTDAQLSGGFYLYKSSAASAQVRPWILAASETFLMLQVDPSTASATPSVNGYQGGMMFGDFFSLVAGDAYNTIIRAADTASSGYPYCLNQTTNFSGADTYPCYAPRGYAGSGSSIALQKCSLGYSIGGGQTGGGSYGQYPAGGIGGIITMPVNLIEQNGTNRAVRGMLPCYWHMTSLATGFTQGDTWSGAAGTSLAGRTFEIVRDSYNNLGFHMETTAGGWTAPTL